ncbi:glucosamine-6-phosphate deaminase [Lacicoccus qingdaonensis]|uniref:Glucosamine-6-phosphate deaminase n=1 Tax=Lacicoccus qingdaonensis TaxID=576118 RepID=A0A1G9B8C3_9BACL|nr:glucosamine-6-phosphate deaminase [Salinicoccus qingdaonensis]SDK35757.1 glucosamine-6-phosphate deaminase [Salinicoccus qingdaonensis]
MEVVTAEDYDGMSKEAAKFIYEAIEKKPDITLGLATGSTPQKMYQYLAEMLNENNIDLSNVHTVNLDEYVGLDGDDKQSYHYFMLEEFFSKVNIPLENTHIPDGKSDDLDAEVESYEKIIADLGGIDLQVLGVGRNGHIGFNEPGTPFNSRTQVVDLTDVTIKDNSRFFDKIEDVPTRALSMGLETIMDTKSILFLASGETKSEAVDALLNGEITEEIPVTILQKHDNLTVMLDKDVLGE